MLDQLVDTVVELLAKLSVIPLLPLQPNHRPFMVHLDKLGILITRDALVKVRQ